MHTADGSGAMSLAKKIEWTSDYAKMRDALLAAGIKDLAAQTSKTLSADDSHASEIMKCGTPNPAPGCSVNVRYLYQVLRGLPLPVVFTEMLLGFELASSDPKFVGLNMVMAEDWYVPIHDFNQHMAMLDYLHSVYPKVHITLHAGELAIGLVPPEDLTFHIRASIDRGHAERIGHGVDVMNEKDPIALLHQMAERNILAEICLSSNDLILGISGDDHPLPIYMKYGVPVALATDDEGVNRSDLTHEFLRAVETYHLSYADLKRMARQSLEHSFLPGQSLWADTKVVFRVASQCVGNALGAEQPSASCSSFLAANERASEQWKLESEFAKFENTNFEKK
jgi:adenosine deaminase